ncbi:hypothetical protein CLV51_1011203 [Chitinophaga niastensis]|uniref:Uncharacterized protein n=1 Tax=Chitinophaga niastensis TaxID=536980 RepID=A0A2P8HUG5_CHINA|nr:hypothetical protein [Chitinophaga niastensis]PSL49866.1 hypothetical protein CLV51_1011203 [Chitinophaga niastensis]
MKTSNKLLIGFSGTLVLLMLFSAIILRADYSKGITNVENRQSSQGPDFKKETIRPFKVLVLTRNPTFATINKAQVKIEIGPDDKSETREEVQYINPVSVNSGDSYSLEHHSNITFTQSGDTLHIFINKPGDINITCPALEAISSNYCDLNVNGLKVPQLNVYAGPKTATYFSGNKVTALSFTGEAASTLSLEDQNIIDTVRIKLGKGSSLTFGDVPYRFSDIKVDSLRELNISGKGLNSITQIK